MIEKQHFSKLIITSLLLITLIGIAIGAAPNPGHDSTQIDFTNANLETGFCNATTSCNGVGNGDITGVTAGTGLTGGGTTGTVTLNATRYNFSCPSGEALNSANTLTGAFSCEAIGGTGITCYSDSEVIRASMTCSSYSGTAYCNSGDSATGGSCDCPGSVIQSTSIETRSYTCTCEAAGCYPSRGTVTVSCCS